jgi:hypothetical protein
MADSIRSFVTAVKGSKNILFVVHEYLPLSLALWVPGVVKTLLAQGKDVTVLIKQEGIGWMQRIDQHYPIDMVLALEELKQVISIPVESEAFGQLSYEIVDNNLNITLIPDDSPVAFNEMRTLIYGRQFDLVVGIGISARHSSMELLNAAKSSLNKATYQFIGTISPQSSLSQALPGNPQVEIIEDPDMDLLVQIAKELKIGIADQQVHDLFTLFLHTHVRMLGKQLSVNSYSFLAELVAGGVDTAKMAETFTGSAAQLNERVQLLLQSMTVSSVGNFAIFGIRNAQLQQYGVTTADLLFATYYLPQYTGIEQCVVVIEEREYEHQVSAFGQGTGIKQLAIKYGFPFTHEFTGGFVSEVNFDKLCQDITRVMAEEEMLPKNARSVVAQAPMPVQQVPVAPIPPEVAASIPVSPSLDEVLAQTVMSAPVETVQEVATPVVVEVNEPPQPHQTPPPASMPAQSAPLPTRQGLDFAAIAKKMKESIAK